MKLKLLSCDEARPDKRAIAKCILEFSVDMDEYLAKELTAYLLEGTTVDIEIEDNNVNSGLRALRKLGIDYEIIE